MSIKIDKANRSLMLRENMLCLVEYAPIRIFMVLFQEECTFQVKPLMHFLKFEQIMVAVGQSTQ